MGGLHRRRHGERRGARGVRAAVAGGVAVVLAAAGTAYAVSVERGCADAPLVLDVAAAPEIAPVVARTAARADGQAGGRCVRIAVRAEEPALMAALLAGRVPLDARHRRPDVWIPDSSLWTARLPRGAAVVVRPSVARSPIVLAGSTGAGSWRELLAGVAAGRTVLRVPDPERSAAGLAVLAIARSSLPGGEASFAALARALRQHVAADARTVPERGAAVVSEQAVGRRAAVTRPREGTLSLDYPLVRAATAPDRVRAAELLERTLNGERAQDAMRAAGFRAPGPQELPAPSAAQVRAVAQAWSRLALGSRMLSLIDVSGSMGAPVPGGGTRLQAIAEVSQDGLALQPDDTELGQWVFATGLDGRRDWRETVPLGPLGRRVGSSTRRQAILSALAALRPEPDGGTGLYDTVLAAFDTMTRTYRAEMVNTVLVFTDGRNDDPDGPSLARALARLRAARDPARPVQIIVIGVGGGVDTAALRKITAVTGGGVYLAATSADIRRIFQTAMARRLCAPDC
ncbi:substrate-binding domain-containing protein [Spirillospora sp. NPDC050679]